MTLGIFVKIPENWTSFFGVKFSEQRVEGAATVGVLFGTITMACVVFSEEQSLIPFWETEREGLFSADGEERDWGTSTIIPLHVSTLWPPVCVAVHGPEEWHWNEMKWNELS